MIDLLVAGLRKDNTFVRHGNVTLTFLIRSVARLRVESIDGFAGKILDTKKIVDVFASGVVSRSASSGGNSLDASTVFVGLNDVI